MADGEVILVLTASAGAGHNMAAAAIGEELRRQRPRLEVEVRDILTVCGPLFRMICRDGYDALVRYAPAWMSTLYEATDRAAQTPEERFRRLVQAAGKSPIERYLCRRRPRLIVNTHWLAAEIAAGLIRRRRLNCPQVTVTTDLETHKIWIQEPTLRYYCATDVGRTYLHTWGVPAERTRVTGIPVRAGFVSPPTRDEARRRCGLRADAPIVLWLCGNAGNTPPRAHLEALIDMPADADLVAIVGRQTKLQGALERVARAARRRVDVVGFTDRMHEYMAAADLAVSKAGGLTVSEALACGLPLVIIHPIPGQEERNSDYLLEAGAAIRVNHVRLLGHRVSELLADPARMEAMRQAARRLARPDAAADIVRDVLGMTGL